MAGIAWRDGRDVVVNPARAPIGDLDAYPIGWDLIEDWDRYRAFGLGRAAVVQFSRGCPHTCTYCGQWMFWRRWRHRDVTKFVDELEWLRREHDVRFVWIADENPTTLKDVWEDVLAEVARRDLGLGICASIRAQDIVRDADILHRYRAAGFLYVLMGVETVTEATLARIRKGSERGRRLPRRAAPPRARHPVDRRLHLRPGGGDAGGTIWRALRGLLRYDGDFVNALYLTPHSWTPLGRETGGIADRRAGPLAVGLPAPGRRREAPEPAAVAPRREAGRAGLPPATASAVAPPGGARPPRPPPAPALRLAHHGGVLVRGLRGRRGPAGRSPAVGKVSPRGRDGSRTTGHHPAPVVADHSLVDAGDARLG